MNFFDDDDDYDYDDEVNDDVLNALIVNHLKDHLSSYYYYY